MDGSRNERARARAQYLLAQIAPLPDDAKVSACVNYPWITFAKQKDSKTKVSPHATPANKSRQP
jgi:hypothetical protein